MYSLLFESNQGDRLTNNGITNSTQRLEYLKKIYVVILKGYNFILFFNLASISGNVDTICKNCYHGPNDGV